jgi:hypothetical protein
MHDIRQIVIDWVACHRKEKGLGAQGPLSETKVAARDDLHSAQCRSIACPWSRV